MEYLIAAKCTDSKDYSNAAIKGFKDYNETTQASFPYYLKVLSWNILSKVSKPLWPN